MVDKTDSIFARKLNPQLAGIPPATVPPRPEDISARAGIAIGDLVRLSANEAPLGPSPRVREAIEAASQSQELHRYPNRTYAALTQAIADFVGVEPSHVLPTAGASEVLPHALQAFCSEGTRVAYIHPGVPRVGREASQRGLDPIRITIGWPYEVTADAITAQLSEDIGLLFITSPNNTTSRLVDPSEIAKLCSELLDTIVFVDEHYVEAADDFENMSAVSLLPTAGNLIVARTFSKVHGMAGLRAGYAVGPPQAIDAMQQVSSRWPLSIPSEAAALAALADTAHFEENRTQIKRGRDYFVAELSRFDALKVTPDPQGNFVLARSSFPPRQVMEGLWKHGVLINGFLYDGHIRITIGTDEMNQRLVKAMKEVLAELEANDAGVNGSGQM